MTEKGPNSIEVYFFIRLLLQRDSFANQELMSTCQGKPSLLLPEHDVSRTKVLVLAGEVVCSEGHYSKDHYTALLLPMRSSLAKAGIDAPCFS